MVPPTSFFRGHDILGLENCSCSNGEATDATGEAMDEDRAY